MAKETIPVQPRTLTMQERLEAAEVKIRELDASLKAMELTNQTTFSKLTRALKRVLNEV